MNKRIRELAEQAGYRALPGFDFANSLEESYMKRFAELIVRECAKVSEDDITDGDACCTNTAYRIAEQIKKHFGVEL